MTAARYSSWWLATSFLIAGCGSAALTAQTATPPASATSSPSPTLIAFSCDAQSGGDASVAAQLTDVRTGHHRGYDQITFEFAAATPGVSLQGLPAFSLKPHPSATFIHDASGISQTLEGSAGLLLVARGASGWDTLTPTPIQTYTGSLDLRPELPVVREVGEIGDFERVLSWGVGMTSQACFHVTTLSNPMRLVIEVQSS